MLSSALFLAAAFTISAAATTPAQPPPLKEIGHVRATAACAELALRANTAISSALRNDTVIAETIERLQNVTLDGNSITRRNSLQALGDYAKDLRARAVSGDREVQKLREIADKATDPVQKKELKAFADTLGGALYRQKKVANDLNGLLAAFDYHDMKPTPEERNVMAGGSETDARRVPLVESNSGVAGGSILDAKHTDTDLARFAASDFQLRLPDISNDEALAANHAVGATNGC